MASKPIPYGIQTLLQFGLLRQKGRGFSALLNCGFFFFNPSMSSSGVGMWTLGSLMLQVQRQLDSLVLVSRPCSFQAFKVRWKHEPCCSLVSPGELSCSSPATWQTCSAVSFLRLYLFKPWLVFLAQDREGSVLVTQCYSSPLLFAYWG